MPLYSSIIIVIIQQVIKKSIYEGFKMNLIDLKSFLAVVEYRSITFAAKKLHVTQSAMTKRIQKIENELNARLVIVDGVKTKITNAGKVFLPYARQIISMDAEMRVNLGHTIPNLESPLIIGTSIYLAHYILPHFVQYLRLQNNKLKLAVKVINERDFFEQLDNGSVDLVICSTRPEVNRAVYSEKLWREKLSLAFSELHPLATKSSSLLTDLAKYEAIFPERKGYIREKVDKLFAMNHLRLDCSLDAGTIYSVKNFISTGEYWSFIHKRLLDMTELLTSDIPGVLLDIDFSLYCINRRVNEKFLATVIREFKMWQGTAEVVQTYAL